MGTVEPVASGWERLLAVLDEQVIPADIARAQLYLGVPHDHDEYVEGCFRCDLSRHETEAGA